MTAANLITTLLKDLAYMAKPGINLLELEERAEAILKLYKGKSVNKGYPSKDPETKPYPAILCLSVNDEIAHTAPRDYVLKEGDVLTIDCGVSINGQVGDAALTVGIGDISSRDRRLIKAAKKALYIGIGEVKAGVKVSAIGAAIERFCRTYDYTVNYSLCGHGVGKKMHEEPSIPMFDVTKRITDPDKEPILKEGQVICIEPHISFKDPYGYLQDDGWGVKTRDGRKAAMFEHMVKVTKDGFEILTTHIDLTPEDLKP